MLPPLLVSPPRVPHAIPLPSQASPSLGYQDSTGLGTSSPSGARQRSHSSATCALGALGQLVYAARLVAHCLRDLKGPG